MKSNYKRLGDYIHKVDERNKQNNSNLLGLSMTKEYRQSTSNIVGTDLSAYKIMRKNRFVCDFMSVIRVYKLPVVLHKTEDIAIVSPAYTTFEVNDISVLLPEYLMLWFRREEFDRYALFKCDSAIRGGFDWDALNDCFLPIPSLDEQQKIVDAYNVIENRIALKRKINDNLEAQARVIYQERCDVTNDEIPEGWRLVKLAEIADDIVCGKTPPTSDISNYGNDIPFITIPDMHRNVFSTQTERCLSQKGATSQSNKNLPPNSICVSCIASAGLVCLTAEVSQTNQQINSIICQKEISPYFVYLKMTTLSDHIKRIGLGGSTTCNVNKTDFSKIEILLPDKETLRKFHIAVTPMFASIRANQYEIQGLESTRTLYLSNIAS